MATVDTAAVTILGIDHLVLRARDMDRMIGFYCDVLGCTVEKRQEKLGLVQLRAGRSLIDLGKLGLEVALTLLEGAELREVDLPSLFELAPVLSHRGFELFLETGSPDLQGPVPLGEVGRLALAATGFIGDEPAGVGEFGLGAVKLGVGSVISHRLLEPESRRTSCRTPGTYPAPKILWAIPCRRIDSGI